MHMPSPDHVERLATHRAVVWTGQGCQCAHSVKYSLDTVIVHMNHLLFPGFASCRFSAVNHSMLSKRWPVSRSRCTAFLAIHDCLFSLDAQQAVKNCELSLTLRHGRLKPPSDGHEGHPLKLSQPRVHCGRCVEYHSVNSVPRPCPSRVLGFLRGRGISDH